MLVINNKLFEFVRSLRQIGIAYVSATSSAVAVSVGLNTLVKVQIVVNIVASTSSTDHRP